MINLKQIFFILLICHGSAMLGFSSPAEPDRQLQVINSGKDVTGKYHLFKKEGLPSESTLKNKKRSFLNVRVASGGAVIYDKLYKVIVTPFLSGKHSFREDADRRPQKHLQYNYPSHNFW